MGDYPSGFGSSRRVRPRSALASGFGPTDPRPTILVPRANPDRQAKPAILGHVLGNDGGRQDQYRLAWSRGLPQAGRRGKTMGWIVLAGIVGVVIALNVWAKRDTERRILAKGGAAAVDEYRRNQARAAAHRRTPEGRAERRQGSGAGGRAAPRARQPSSCPPGLWIALSRVEVGRRGDRSAVAARMDRPQARDDVRPRRPSAGSPQPSTARVPGLYRCQASTGRP